MTQEDSLSPLSHQLTRMIIISTITIAIIMTCYFTPGLCAPMAVAQSKERSSNLVMPIPRGPQVTSITVHGSKMLYADFLHLDGDPVFAKTITDLVRALASAVCQLGRMTTPLSGSHLLCGPDPAIVWVSSENDCRSVVCRAQCTVLA
jgi:hypothetical protein